MRGRNWIPGRPFKALKQRHVSSTRTGPLTFQLPNPATSNQSTPLFVLIHMKWQKCRRNCTLIAANRAFSFDISSGSPCNSGTVDKNLMKYAKDRKIRIKWKRERVYSQAWENEKEWSCPILLELPQASWRSRSQTSPAEEAPIQFLSPLWIRIPQNSNQEIRSNSKNK